MNAPVPECQTYDIEGAAAWLGVKPTWVRDKVTARAIPHTRVGRHVKFTAEHLRAILAAGEQPLASDQVRHRPRSAARPSGAVINLTGRRAS